MIPNKIYILLFLISSFTVFSQVKVGDNPSQINPNSLLELESTSKAFVLSRMTSAQMNAITPLQGAMVYNTNEKCIFMFEGLSWKSLCDKGTTLTTATTPPTLNEIGDFWIDTTTSRDIVNIWNGTNWISININPKNGTGPPTTVTVPSPIAGDIYVDETSGELFTYNGSTWLNNTTNNNVTANNGISKNMDNIIQLGGILIKATEITTDQTNTLAISGLQQTNNIVENEIVLVDKNTGILKKIEASSLIREEEIVVIATEGQSQFNPPLPITNSKKIDVYRNGVRIAFTAIDGNTIELEPEARCYKNDEIRIVQFY